MPSLGTVRRTLTTAVVFFFCMLMAVGCDISKVDQKHFDQIKVGMAEADIQKILGKPVDTKSMKMPGGDTAGEEVWKEGDKKITVTFINQQATTVTKEGF